MIADPYFYFLAIPALLIVGISKGGFGGGVGMVGVPMISLAVSPVTAAAIMLPILCLMDMFALRGFRGNYDKGLLLSIFPAAFIGMTIGALSFSFLTEQHIKLMIAVVTLLFCADAALKVVRKRIPEPKPQSWKRSSLWSTIAGFTSFSVHAGGPPLNFYLLPLRLDKSVYVSTTIAFFAFINIVKLVPYSTMGLFSKDILLTALVLAPVAPLGIWIGVWMHHRMDDKLFYRVCYSLLFVTGLKLAYDGIVGP